MSTLQEIWPFLVSGFKLSILLLLTSGAIATVVGTMLAAMRVSPVLPFRAFGTSYVNIFRNTPLVVLFILVVEGLPAIGIKPTFPPAGLNEFETMAIVTLAVYTAAFVCEALRSGINTVDAGQAEAARAVGMTFGQTLGLVVLPQAFRAVIPPLTNVYIACFKNTSVAAVFGVLEATFQLRRMIEATVAPAPVLLIAIAAGYVVIVWVISGIAALVERQVATAR